VYYFVKSKYSRYAFWLINGQNQCLRNKTRHAKICGVQMAPVSDGRVMLPHCRCLRVLISQNSPKVEGFLKKH